MTTKVFVVALILMMSPALALSASVYKWTDDRGVTHFGDRQPVGQNAESVNVRTGRPNSENASPSAQEQMQKLDERKQSKVERANLSAVEEARQKQRKANCETARSNLSIMNSNARIRVEENGEQRYLSPEEIDEQREKHQDIADKNCGPAAE
ncbi:DUF4124 domain-containing protein [Marinobacter caseinilyticus]|uniref:DUF4124 domain-containing protein n=1 Tax=Marinobacter caseinilyticus TaxID=2692195 RepID=UPI001409D5A4|nr:DUF4124 domain-containing protein [Marinobacter caseinilyticus]